MSVFDEGAVPFSSIPAPEIPWNQGYRFANRSFLTGHGNFSDSLLDADELRDALDLLHPDSWINWRYPSEHSLHSLPQQVPDVPFRAVFAYNSPHTDVGKTASTIFSELASFYRQRFGDDAKLALEHSSSLRWINMVDSICIADGPQI